MLDFRTGEICAVLANINRSKKRRKPFTPQDFMPAYEKKKQTSEDMLETVKAMNQVYGEPEQQIKIDMTGKSTEEIREIVEGLNKG